MSCELKTLITVFILSTIALNLSCRTFSATSEREGYSEEYSFNIFNNFADESGALEFNLTNPNLKRSRRTSSKPDVSADSSYINTNETIPLQSSKYMYESRPNDNASMHLNNEKTPLRSYHKKAFEIEAGFQGDAPGMFSFF